jgi:hypothetical protein
LRASRQPQPTVAATAREFLRTVAYSTGRTDLIGVLQCLYTPRSIDAGTFCMVLSAALPVSLSQISGRHSGAANCTGTLMKHLRQSLGAGDKMMRLLQEI